MITFKDFKEDIVLIQRPKHIRFGQHVFIYLNSVNPQLATDITGTDRDMFNQTYVTNEQFEYLEKHWEDYNND